MRLHPSATSSLRHLFFGSAALLFAICIAAPLTAQAPAQATAAEIMEQTRSEAAAEHKNILLVFSASWCGPCHLFEAFLKDPKIRPIMDKYFVESTLDVGERPTDTRHHDTPGAVDLRASLGGSESYPFIAMLDASGSPITDSLRPDGGHKSNIGYPDSQVEIDWFLQMLHKAVPSMSLTEADTVRRWLTEHSHSR